MSETSYKYMIDQCQVGDKESLKTYRELRCKWLDWLTHDKHSINAQLIQMSWDYALFSAVNELRKIASENQKPNIGFNGSVSRLFDSGFITTQIFFIRRLIDSRPDVISLNRLINDIRNNLIYVTRENYICNDGLPYDADKLEDEWLIKQSEESEPKAVWLETEGPNAWSTSKRRHNEFDALSGIKKDARNRCDVMRGDLLDMLIDRLKRCADIKEYSHKYLAHTADKESREELTEEQKKITLGKIDKCHRAIYAVSSVLGRLLEDKTMLSPLPTPQYDHLQYLDKQWADAEMLEAAHETWDKRANEVEKWGTDLWPDVDVDD